MEEVALQLKALFLKEKKVHENRLRFHPSHQFFCFSIVYERRIGGFGDSQCAHSHDERSR